MPTFDRTIMVENSAMGWLVSVTDSPVLVKRQPLIPGLNS